MYKLFSKQNEYSFCTPFHTNNQQLKLLAKERNDNIYSYNHNFDSKFRKLYIYLTARNILNEKFDVIHIHSGSILTLLLVSKMASKKNIKKIIVHSHATGYNNFSHKFIKKISDKHIENYATNFLACSKEAGIFKFPKNIINTKRFIVLKNGIDLDKYSFDQKLREKKRKELKLVDYKVLCNVGRFSKEKNHKFILDVFYEYVKLEPRACLLLIGGDGEEESNIITMIKNYHLEKKVMILKNRTDVNELLFASDVFIFPSLFEGLGISAIEAQASGLPTICASHLPRELNASSNYIGLDIKQGPKKWAKIIFDNQSLVRNDCISELKLSGYDLNDSATILEKIYKED